MSIQIAALRTELPVALKRLGLAVAASTVVVLVIHRLRPSTETATGVGVSLGVATLAGGLWESHVRGQRLAFVRSLIEGVVAGGSVYAALAWLT